MNHGNAAWPAPGCNLKERDPVSAGQCCLSLARISQSAGLEDPVLLVASPSEAYAWCAPRSLSESGVRNEAGGRVSTKHHAIEAHSGRYATRKREALGRSPTVAVESA
jgi:hypothetical protein